MQRKKPNTIKASGNFTGSNPKVERQSFLSLSNSWVNQNTSAQIYGLTEELRYVQLFTIQLGYLLSAAHCVMINKLKETNFLYTRLYNDGCFEIKTSWFTCKFSTTQYISQLQGEMQLKMKLEDNM